MDKKLAWDYCARVED